MKTKVVIFQPHGGARVYTNQHMGTPGALLDPKLGKVKGLSPDFWKLDGAGEIVPMTDEEQAAVLKQNRTGPHAIEASKHAVMTKVLPRARRLIVAPKPDKWLWALTVLNSIALLAELVLRCI